MVTIYGIRNCDTVRKARRWLDARAVDYTFHDLRSDGLDKAMLQDWVRALGWENLLNRRGTTWRKLSAAVRDHIDARSALTLMLEQPTLIKRPVLALDNDLHLGFSETAWEALFQSPRT